MPHFMLIATDRPDSLEKRLANRPAHLAYLAEQSAQVRLAGSFPGEDDTPAGSLILLEVASRADVDRFVANDPYTKAGLFAAIEIKPWRIAIDSISK